MHRWPLHQGGTTSGGTFRLGESCRSMQVDVLPRLKSRDSSESVSSRLSAARHSVLAVMIPPDACQSWALSSVVKQRWRVPRRAVDTPSRENMVEANFTRAIGATHAKLRLCPQPCAQATNARASRSGAQDADGPPGRGVQALPVHHHPQDVTACPGVCPRASPQD